MERRLGPIGLFSPLWNHLLKLGFFLCGVVAVLYIERKYCSRYGCNLYSFLIIVISLQLYGRRQIVEPRKYCLVRVIFFFFGMCFLYFLFLTGLEFGLIPYKAFRTTPIREWSFQNLEDTK